MTDSLATAALRFFRPLERLLALSAAECGLALVVLLRLPTDPENALWLGLSARRWLLVGAALLAGLLLAGLALISRRSITWKNRLGHALLSPAAFTFLTLGLLTGMAALAATLLTPDQALAGMLSRLAPLAGLTALVCAQFAAWHWILAGSETRASWQAFPGRLSNHLDHVWNILLEFTSRPGWSLALTLVLAAVPLFLNALRYSLPLGYSGLYALMARGIIQSGGGLPAQVPYYGPGGMPFAYPPLGFYLMALFTGVLGLPELVYLRFAPAVFSFLALIPLDRLAYRLTGSRLGASLSVLLVAFSWREYIVHVYSAGAVRALALFFAVWALERLVAGLQSGRTRLLIGAALLFGLTILTHWGYALFFALVTAVYALLSLKWNTILKATAVGLGGGLLALPWLGLMIQRYGTGFIQGAFGSHSNDQFLRILAGGSSLAEWLQESLRTAFTDPLSGGLAVMGILLLLARGKVQWPAVFLAVLLFIAEGDRFTFLIGGLLAAFVLPELARAAGNRTRAAVLAGLAIFWLVLGGLRPILAARPELSTETFNLAAAVQAKTSPDERYLALTTPEEAEWFPYLFERVPAAASWGAEWSGRYNRELDSVLLAAECARTQNLADLQHLIASLEALPDVLITHQEQTELNAALLSGGAWHKVYENEDYCLWR